eukprot:8636739-Pyramimonas_sp.AAC.1
MVSSGVGRSAGTRPSTHPSACGSGAAGSAGTDAAGPSVAMSVEWATDARRRIPSGFGAGADGPSVLRG